jgi:AbrB family looped-hinge helix DNA binding protein
MTHKVGTKGQVVIPKAIRDLVGIRPGDEVTFEPDGSEVRVRRTADAEACRREEIRALRGSWKGTRGGSTQDLVKERRKERVREEKRAREQGVGRT